MKGETQISSGALRDERGVCRKEETKTHGDKEMS